MQIVKKMTIKTCGDFTTAKIRAAILATLGKDPKDADGKAITVAPDGTAVSLLKIAGEATNAATGQTDKGTFTRLMGSFVGTDLTTGELYQSGQCILPDYIGSQIGAAVLSAGADGNGAVQFAFEIGAKAKANAITGYEFSVKPLIESKPSTAMMRLMGLAGIEAPKLPAPAAANSGDTPPPAKFGKK
jgi:hypothetical protein